MRTNIDIDDRLLADAMEMLGLNTKKATVEEALKRLIDNERLQRAIESIRGTGWDGDLDAIRRNWSRE